MNTKEAITQIKALITNCDEQKFADVLSILELGGGNRFLEEKTPEAKRNSTIMELVDAVVYSTANDEAEYRPEAEFHPCYMGSWELVLATLVLEGDWGRIAETAQELRTENRGTPHF